MYDESHIGNKEYSYNYVCPHCGYDGTDYDGFCVKCGEKVIDYNKKVNKSNKSKIKMPPIARKILLIVAICFAVFIVFTLGFNAGMSTTPSAYEQKTVKNTDSNNASQSTDIADTRIEELSIAYMTIKTEVEGDYNAMNTVLSVALSGNIISQNEYDELSRSNKEVYEKVISSIEEVKNKTNENIEMSTSSAYRVALNTYLELQNSWNNYADTFFNELKI